MRVRDAFLGDASVGSFIAFELDGQRVHGVVTDYARTADIARTYITFRLNTNGDHEFKMGTNTHIMLGV